MQQPGGCKTAGRERSGGGARVAPPPTRERRGPCSHVDRAAVPRAHPRRPPGQRVSGVCQQDGSDVGLLLALLDGCVHRHTCLAAARRRTCPARDRCCGWTRGPPDSPPIGPRSHLRWLATPTRCGCAQHQDALQGSLQERRVGSAHTSSCASHPTKHHHHQWLKSFPHATYLLVAARLPARPQRPPTTSFLACAAPARSPTLTMKAYISLLCASAVALALLVTAPAGAHAQAATMQIYDEQLRSNVKVQWATSVTFNGQTVRTTRDVKLDTVTGVYSFSIPRSVSAGPFTAVTSLSWVQASRSDHRCHRPSMDISSATVSKERNVYCFRSQYRSCSTLAGCRCKGDKIIRVLLLDAQGRNMRVSRPGSFYLCGL